MFRLHKTSGIWLNRSLTKSQMVILNNLKIKIGFAKHNYINYSVLPSVPLCSTLWFFYSDKPCHSTYGREVQGKLSMVLSSHHVFLRNLELPSVVIIKPSSIHLCRI